MVSVSPDVGREGRLRPSGVVGWLPDERPGLRTGVDRQPDGEGAKSRDPDDSHRTGVCPPKVDARRRRKRSCEIAREAPAQLTESPVEIEVGEDEPVSPPAASVSTRPERNHERIQYRLLQLGHDLGLDLWVARNDRSSTYKGSRFGDMSVEELPVRFDDTTRRTIELIDVLWLQRNRIEAAFEIESTTSIFSGLLRMGDLLAMQPNIDIPLFIVAPEERRQAVFREIRRPVFAGLRPPLAKACRFIGFERLESELDALGPRTRYLRLAFLDELAETAT
jgi:hypothetical protein